MEIFFNELSVNPFPNTPYEVTERIKLLLETMKELRSHGFNVLRTHDSFYSQALSSLNYSISDWLVDKTISQTLRDLLISICRAPFIEDDDTENINLFVEHEFTTENYDGAMINNPEGLASAYLYESHVISFTTHSFWEKPVLILNVDGTEKNIINFYRLESVKSEHFENWLNSLKVHVSLNTADNIRSTFTEFEFDDQAIDDIIFWYYNDKRFLVRIVNLLKDIHRHPFSGGMGHTEVLKGEEGKASKRIIKKDRLVYTYNIDKSIIHSCRGHYGT